VRDKKSQAKLREIIARLGVDIRPGKLGRRVICHGERDRMSSMDSEDQTARLVRAEYAPKPGRFKDVDPRDLIGFLVKVGFVGHTHDGHETVEHMWLRVDKAVDDRTMECEVRNEPVLCGPPAFNSRVAVTVADIEEVM
jgi:hypothetical protein